ncbi:hypothetical protein WJX84_000943 [Apatococcus fuscideae]|uniref:Uncharacterized protein n=1 Tax=Apatococcus fuscideae TaxID=2026836 RepID=A0AAW1T4H4_9CHLO
MPSWPQFESQPLTFAPKVLLGCCDGTAAGLKALLSLESPAHEQQLLSGHSLDDPMSAEQAFGAPELPAAPLLHVQHCSDSKNPLVTCLALNAAVPDSQAAMLRQADQKPSGTASILQDLPPGSLSLLPLSTASMLLAFQPSAFSPQDQKNLYGAC